jgi:ABC-2 type transport system permease protein
MKPQVYALIIKEFLAVLRDKKTRIVLIMPPLVQLFLFSFAVTLEVKNVSIGVYNKDSGHESYEIIQRLWGSPTFHHIIYLTKEEDIKPTLDQQKALMVVQFPADFSRKVQGHESATMQLILDGRRTNSASIALGYINDIINQYNQDFLAHSNKELAPAILVRRNWFNPNLDFTWYTVPSLVALLSMLIALVLTSLSIAREREMGTFEQLLVSPLTPREILLGKTVPALLLAMAEGTVILICAIFVFGIKFQGSFLLLYGSMTIFLLAIVGCGLFISSLCKTQQQTVVGTFLFMIPSVNLSGFATPVENMPHWLQYVAQIIPLKHFLIVMKGTFLKDISARIVFDNTWPNVIIAICTLSAATWLFRRRME